MPQYEVHKLFPTPLFVYDDLTTTEEERNFVYNQEWLRQNSDNGWMTNNYYLLNEPVLKTLKTGVFFQQMLLLFSLPFLLPLILYLFFPVLLFVVLLFVVLTDYYY